MQADSCYSYLLPVTFVLLKSIMSQCNKKQIEDRPNETGFGSRNLLAVITGGLKGSPPNKRAGDPINTRTLPPTYYVQGCGSADFFMRQADGGQRRQKKVSNSHHVIEAKNAYIFRNTKAQGKKMLISNKSYSIVSAD